jgi:hypothetical protein
VREQDDKVKVGDRLDIKRVGTIIARRVVQCAGLEELELYVVRWDNGEIVIRTADECGPLIQ